ncbi:MAG: prolyl oligopeptidase family serine peptidase [Tepidisphaeraceae bacterium]
MRLALVVLVFLLTGCASSLIKNANGKAPPETGFVTRPYTNGNGSTRKYTVFVPHNYDRKQRWPAIVFLHGIGEAGSDGTKCLTVGLGPAIAKRADAFPFIAIFPQSDGGWTANGASGALAIDILEQVKKDYTIDPDRIVLTGLSTGGYGTWAIGAKHREQFAGLVPMCAYTDYDAVSHLSGLPVWCFHNSGDPFVSSGGSREMVKRINAAGGNAKYTEYKAFGHDVWVKAYQQDELYEWMLAQRRNGKGFTAKTRESGTADARR